MTDVANAIADVLEQSLHVGIDTNGGVQLRVVPRNIGAQLN